MSLKVSWQRYTLDFTFGAGTSRGVMKTRDTWLIKVWRKNEPEVFGIGEAGPLPGLSIDHRPDFEETLDRILNRFTDATLPGSEDEVLLQVTELVPAEWPSIRFALETALLDLLNGGQRDILPEVIDTNTRIPINGLIWMGDKPFMLEQMETKLAAGYTCLKMKIGAIDREEEREVLRAIRQRRSTKELILRVDANGAYEPNNALSYLRDLEKYGLHSIEQPIKPGQPVEMKKLCASSPVPIALDEELIGIHAFNEKASLLDTIQPFAIVLKPGLVGGLAATREWIHLAQERGITWWITSMLESNIGLNAIGQLAAEYQPIMHQGLGTGQLYHNNFPSPMVIQQGSLQYDLARSWDLSQLTL